MDLIEEYIHMCELLDACGGHVAMHPLRRGMALDHAVERGAAQLLSDRHVISLGWESREMFADWVARYRDTIQSIMRREYDL